MTYTPDVWVVLELIDNSYQQQTTYKILAGWYGGFAGSNSWKLNSGITKVTETDTHYEFEGYSGSGYSCLKDAERFSALTQAMFDSWVKESQDSGDVFSIRRIDVKDLPRELWA